MKKFEKIGKAVAVFLFWILIWYLLSLKVNKQLLLPSPVSVLTRMAELMKSAIFWEITFGTIGRIMLGVIVAVLLGLVFALFGALSNVFSRLFSPINSIMTATPVASFIILALVWMGRETVPVFISIIMVIPIVYRNVSSGIRNTDKKLIELSKVYKVPFLKTVKNIYFPSVMPYFLSAFRSAMGLAWKAGIAAEVLTVPKNSIGKMIYESKLYLETTDLFAWTVVVILLSIIIEKIVMLIISKAGRKYNVKEGDSL